MLEINHDFNLMLQEQCWVGLSLQLIDLLYTEWSWSLLLLFSFSLLGLQLITVKRHLSAVTSTGKKLKQLSCNGFTILYIIVLSFYSDYSQSLPERVKGKITVTGGHLL